MLVFIGIIIIVVGFSFLHLVPRISCLQENTFVNESDGIIQLHIERTGNMEFGSRVEIEVVPITATGT